MSPCPHGHTTGRYADGKCIECKRLYNLARNHAKLWQRRKPWEHQIKFTIDRETAAEAIAAAKATKVTLSAFIREAIEWRLMEEV